MTAEPSAAASHRDPDDWLSARRFALLLGLLICATYPDIIFGGNTFFHRDFSAFGYPLAAYQRECFWRGELPLWTPLSYCGLPFLAQWNTMTLYPLSLFYLLLPLSWSLAVFCLGHLFLGGMGMYYLARNWTGNALAAGVAGLGFVFNAVLLHSLMWPNNMAGFGWMPWVILSTERAWRNGGRDILLAALVGAVQMLSGAPEVILLTWLFLGSFAVIELVRHRESRARLALRCGLVVALVAGLAAAQLLPFLDLLRASQRDQSFSDSMWSMPVWGWANFVVPLFRARPSPLGIYVQPDQFWIQSYYLGVGVATLAALAVAVVRRARVWLLAGATLVCLVLALGDDGLVYAAMRRLLPGLGFMRFPIKFVILPTALMPLLAAFFVAHCRNAEGMTWARIKRLMFGMTAVVLVGIVLIVLAAFWFPFKGTSAEVALHSGLSRIVLLVLCCAALYALREGRPGLQKLAPFWLLGLIWADMMTSGPRPNPGVPRWVYEPGLVARDSGMEPLPKVGDGRAMLSAAAQGSINVSVLTNATDTVIYQRLATFGNLNLLDDLPKVIGSYSLYSRELGDVLTVLFGTSDPPPGLMDFLSISQVNAPGRVTQWLPRPSHLPWVTAGQKPTFADAATTLKMLGAAQFDPRHEVILSHELRGAVGATNVSTPVLTTKEFTTGRVDVEIQAREPALVVIAQSYSPNWRASVDGRATTLLRANHAFQAVEVQAGTHEVVLTYVDRAFQAGLAISLISLAGVLTALFRVKGAARNEPDAPISPLPG